MDVRPLDTGLPFLSGGSATGAFMRAHDWARSSLGVPATWPEPLKAAIGLSLEQHFPTLIYWGNELAVLYNDACRAILGPERAPRMLGRPAREAWGPLWEAIGPPIEMALHAGTPAAWQDRQMTLQRNGTAEETYFTCSHSPIRGADGRIGGVLSIMNETTEHVLGTRRLDALRRLGDGLAGAYTLAEGCRAVQARLHGQPDTPFVLVYLAAGDGRARLASSPVGHAPAEVDLAEPDDWRIADAIGTGRMMLLDDLPRRFGALPSGPWPEPPTRAAVLPLERPEQDGGAAAGALVLGLNSRRRFDAAYEGFLRLLAGQVTAAFGALRAREAAATAARARHEELLAVLEAVPTAVWFTHDPDALVAWGNRAAADLLRLPRSGNYRLTAGDRARMGLTVQRDGMPVGADQQPLRRAARGEEIPGEELELHFADGTSRHVISHARPLHDAAGALAGAVLAVTDITDRKRAEAALQEANESLEARVEERTAELAASIEELRTEMEERERVETTLRQMQRLEAVGQLTAGVAHDFNNLLTVILGNIEFLQRGASEPNARRLAAMRMAADRGASLTAQLLAFARRQQLQPRAVDLNAVIEGMADLLRTTAGGTVTVRTALSPLLDPALVDRTQIELVILNLTLNARDAMPRGGRLTVATRATWLPRPRHADQPDAGRYVTLEVTDTGIGMAEEVRAHAFEPFFTTKPAGQGSGLGLAQVYGFAQQSGGGVELHSRPGEGTTVLVHLPLARRSAEQEPALPAPDAAQTGAARVLLVDDDAGVRNVTETILQDAGCAVLSVEGGAAALSALDGGAEFDVLVADFAMPGMNGEELARAARRRRPALPVLFITGYAEPATLGSVERAAVLRKPFRGEDLVRQVILLHGQGA